MDYHHSDDAEPYYKINCPRCDNSTVSWDWSFPIWGPNKVIVRGQCNYCAQRLQREYGFWGIRDCETNQIIAPYELTKAEVNKHEKQSY